MQQMLLASQRETMLNRGKLNALKNEAGEQPHDFKPVVKLFCPWGAATWLLTELDPEDPDRAFGLCDLGMSFPELGYVSLAELRAIRGPGGLYIERDAHFHAGKTLSAYADEARKIGRIAA